MVCFLSLKGFWAVNFNVARSFGVWLLLWLNDSHFQYLIELQDMFIKYILLDLHVLESFFKLVNLIVQELDPKDYFSLNFS